MYKQNLINIITYFFSNYCELIIYLLYIMLYYAIYIMLHIVIFRINCFTIKKELLCLFL